MEIDDTIYAGRRPGAGWEQVAHGVHLREDQSADLRSRLMAWQLALPFHTSFTGLTVAQLNGWWLPPLPGDLPLFVASGDNDRIRRSGLDVCRHDVTPRWEFVKGVRITPAAETILACARELELLDVVLIGDAALRAGDVTRDQLHAVARQRRRGSPLLRRAIPLMNGKAESIYEGLLRMLHLVCGVEVEPQVDVIGSHGDVVARGDLILVGTRTLHEYDGEDHLPRARQRRDLRRVRRLMSAGYQRRGFVREDVLFGGMGILRDADAAVGRPHDPARAQAWFALLRDSLFTPSGTQRLRDRLGCSDG
jgi:very-short-patch-repair endonuclease